MDSRSFDESTKRGIGLSWASLLQSCNTNPRYSYPFLDASHTCNNPEIPHHHWVLGWCVPPLQLIQALMACTGATEGS
ncbi:hypothetical protein SXHG_00106 [Synechococcus phage MRHenn-2013a]|nr:hypothetical protein SXHG_00106 [Synechococcus phage MRHenn-2013a]